MRQLSRVAPSETEEHNKKKTFNAHYKAAHQLILRSPVFTYSHHHQKNIRPEHLNTYAADRPSLASTHVYLCATNASRKKNRASTCFEIFPRKTKPLTSAAVAHHITRKAIERDGAKKARQLHTHIEAFSLLNAYVHEYVNKNAGSKQSNDPCSRCRFPEFCHLNLRADVRALHFTSEFFTFLFFLLTCLTFLQSLFLQTTFSAGICAAVRDSFTFFLLLVDSLSFSDFVQFLRFLYTILYDTS